MEVVYTQICPRLPYNACSRGDLASRPCSREVALAFSLLHTVLYLPDACLAFLRPLVFSASRFKGRLGIIRASIHILDVFILKYKDIDLCVRNSLSVCLSIFICVCVCVCANLYILFSLVRFLFSFSPFLFRPLALILFYFTIPSLLSSAPSCHIHLLNLPHSITLLFTLDLLTLKQ